MIDCQEATQPGRRARSRAPARGARERMLVLGRYGRSAVARARDACAVPAVDGGAEARTFRCGDRLGLTGHKHSRR